MRQKIRRRKQNHKRNHKIFERQRKNHIENRKGNNFQQHQTKLVHNPLSPHKKLRLPNRRRFLQRNQLPTFEADSVPRLRERDQPEKQTPLRNLRKNFLPFVPRIRSLPINKKLRTQMPRNLQKKIHQHPQQLRIQHNLAHRPRHKENPHQLNFAPQRQKVQNPKRIPNVHRNSLPLHQHPNRIQQPKPKLHQPQPRQILRQIRLQKHIPTPNIHHQIRPLPQRTQPRPRLHTKQTQQTSRLHQKQY